MNTDFPVLASTAVARLHEFHPMRRIAARAPGHRATTASRASFSRSEPRERASSALSVG